MVPEQPGPKDYLHFRAQNSVSYGKKEKKKNSTPTTPFKILEGRVGVYKKTGGRNGQKGHTIKLDGLTVCEVEINVNKGMKEGVHYSYQGGGVCRSLRMALVLRPGGDDHPSSHS